MSRRRQVECVTPSKTRYATEEEARDGGRENLRHLLAAGRTLELYVYRCPWCPAYHLTSRPSYGTARNERIML